MTVYSADQTPVAGGRFIWPEWRRNLTPGVWSANLAANTYVDAVIERKKTDADFGTYYAAAGQPAVTVSSQNPWAYSSGCYAPGHKKYFFTGGGHDDWLGSEVGVFDLLTLSWSRTDESAKLAKVEDPSVPFQSADSADWRAWRNPSGRFAPISSHMYGGMIYLPSIDKIHVAGAAPYRSGMGSVGGTTWIDSAGLWDEDGALAGNGAPVNSSTHTLPAFTVVDASLAPTGETITGAVFRVSASGSVVIDKASNRVLTHTTYWSAQHSTGDVGCFVPDPVYSGHLAYVTNDDASNYAVFHRADIVRLDGKIGDILNRPYANARPAAFDLSGAVRWFYMGDWFPSSTKILAFKDGQGVWALDAATWTWGDQVATMPVSASAGGLWKRIEYMPEFRGFGFFSNIGAEFRFLPISEDWL